MLKLLKNIDKILKNYLDNRMKAEKNGQSKKADVSQHSRQHTIYKNAAGVRLPGVTTLVGLRDKPALPSRPQTSSGSKASTPWPIGRSWPSSAGQHTPMVYAKLSGTKFDPQDYTPRQIDRAENGFIKFLDWLKGRKLEPIILEQPLVSERHQWGGTPDIYCRLDGRSSSSTPRAGRDVAEHSLPTRRLRHDRRGAWP